MEFWYSEKHTENVYLSIKVINNYIAQTAVFKG